MHSSANLPLISVLPFVVTLLGIAVLPLVAPGLWERNRNKAIFSFLVAAPVAVGLALRSPAVLRHAVLEYVSFICLLGALYVVTGGIHLGGDLRATPRNNVLILGAGAVLASLLGTTGASMLLVRLLLRTNSQRRHSRHVPFFFILLVANAGGLLTPLGDPPLFLGFLRGVPFAWTLRLFPIWLVAVGYLLTLFYWVDARAYAREAPGDLAKDEAMLVPLRIEGRGNLLWLGLVGGSVFLPSPYRELVMVLSAAASVVLGPQAGRAKNQFAFAPIAEVAILFAGIFVTMAPALIFLTERGPSLQLSAPWQFFLASGALSSVLDNAPTYLTFLTAAQSKAASLGLTGTVVSVPGSYLAAISAGSVLMGANTYIGNGPNFMVKALAETAGYRMPHFARYAVLAVVVLAPVYLLTALLLKLY